MRAVLGFGLAMAAAVPAAAQDRDYCPARPGLGDTPCTISPGRVSLELGALGWEQDETPAERTDVVTAADLFVRLGVGPATEVSVAWTPYTRVRVRDRATRALSSDSGTGDVTLMLKHNLQNPDGGGVSVALEPFVSLPVGSGPGTAGDWGYGLVVPLSFDLGNSLSLQLTPQIEAAVDGDGSGQHFAAGGVLGLGLGLTDSLGATAELQLVQDDDPAGESTQAYAGLSFAWMPNDELQLDVGGAAGLNGDSGDFQIYAGISRRF